jgi:hypothetical protein
MLIVFIHNNRWKGITSGPMASVGDVTHPQALVNHHVSNA